MVNGQGGARERMEAITVSEEFCHEAIDVMGTNEGFLTLSLD